MEKTNFEKTISLFQLRLKRLQNIQKGMDITKVDSFTRNLITDIVDLEKSIESEDNIQKEVRERISDMISEFKYSV